MPATPARVEVRLRVYELTPGGGRLPAGTVEGEDGLRVLDLAGTEVGDPGIRSLAGLDR